MVNSQTKSNRSLLSILFTFAKNYPVFIVSSALLLIGLIFYFSGQTQTSEVVYQVIIVIGGIPLAYETLKQLLKRNFGADVIAILAIVVSFILHEYLAGAIVVLMLSGGRALEDYALRNASDALKKLAEAAPRIAHLVKADSISEIKVNQVEVGDVLLVKPGELIPVDGVIIEGETSINESALTGEPVPTNKVSSSAVLSGSVNLDNPIKIKAIHRATDSKYEQIVRIVRQAQESKAPIIRLADRYGAIFTPITLLVAFLTYLLTQNVTNFLAVLVVATPCPLILATPIAIMGGINKAAKRGIIVKNGGSLEQIGDSHAVVFDKTGTLTFGIPKIIEIRNFSKVTNDKILQKIASVERLSAHILSKAIVAEADRQKLKLSFPENFKEKFGKGVSGEIDGEKIAIGSWRFLETLGATLNPEQKKLKQDQNALGVMVSFISFDKLIVASILFGDQIRPEIKKTIQELKSLGIEKVAMLTGDSPEVAFQVATETGIDTVKAQSLPDQKVDFINKLKKDYKNVVMVGDGFNDAPALISATVGIALGEGGSSVSSESADIVLVENDIDKVNDVIRIGKRVLSIAKGGIWFGMGASFVAMGFAAFGYISPVKGAILQEVIDVIVIFNALRSSR